MFFFKTTDPHIAVTNFQHTIRLDCLGVDLQNYVFPESGELDLSIGVVQSGERADPSLAQRWFTTHILIIHQRGLVLKVEIVVFVLVYKYFQ